MTEWRPTAGSWHRRYVIPLALIVITLAGSIAAAQRIWVGRGRFGRTPPKWATQADFDGSFLYCRGFYTSAYREAGGTGWWTDYPGADNNFSVRLAELTRVHVKIGRAHV